MARPYSTDLRERVVEAVNEGATRLEAAERFGVSVSSAVRWHQAWRETGTFEAKLCGGSCSPLDDYADEILALVEEQDDRSLDIGKPKRPSATQCAYGVDPCTGQRDAVYSVRSHSRGGQATAPADRRYLRAQAT